LAFAAPPAPVPDSQQKASGSAVTAEDVLSNPGTYEKIGRKLKGTYAFMECIRFVL
jgi:hypothetical protein